MGLMMPPKIRSGGNSGRLSTLPAPVAVPLCLACFLLGYIAHRPAWTAETALVQVTSAPRRLQAPNAAQKHLVQTIQPPELPHLPAQTNTQALTPQLHQQPTQPAASQLPPVGELLDNDQFAEAYLQQSGLLALRPPLQPAASGNDYYTVVPYQIISWYPRILVYPNFIDKQRAQHIINLAKGKMRPSGLSWRPNEHHDDSQQIRTSSGVFLSSQEDPDGVLAWVEQKIASVTLLPTSHGEAFNVLRYELNQKYDSHMDTFDPKDFGPQPSQRVATMLLYLSDVEEGGETVFKREGADGSNRPVVDWSTCEEHDFKYKPRMGDAVLFYSLNPDLTINPRALHGGCPVKKGEKWVATRWMHEKPVPSH